jgi:hypothetical protein
VPGLQEEPGVARRRREGSRPFSKRCYHKQKRSAKPAQGAKSSEPALEPDYERCPECGAAADVLEGGICSGCHFDFTNALYWWFVR